MTAWLVVGHGSVGSALVRRMRSAGLCPSVYDPSPRIAVTGAEHLTMLDAGSPRFDCLISCVIPSAAAKALEALRSALKQSTLYLDWNTLTPRIKQQIAAAAPCGVVDVAL
jgi:3-hydroxyisobutyrate dehydrogenase-like beta-hydroxyacid dehydrogenase